MTGGPVIDTLIGFRRPTGAQRDLDRVAPSLRAAVHPAEYMYKDLPDGADPTADLDDVVADTVTAMDAHGISAGVTGLTSPAAVRAAVTHPDRFVFAADVDGNDIAGSVGRIAELHAAGTIGAVQMFPPGTDPQVPADDARWYPIYAECAARGLPVFCTAGVPGPRVPMACQHVERFDRVMYDFPELVLVLRHGAEPWPELAVKLMLKWPGLHYSTSAFAPKHYPQAIIDYVNTRGAHKVMYAGYFPYALTLERIFAELADVPLRPEARQGFLHDNAARVLGLDSATGGAP